MPPFHNEDRLITAIDLDYSGPKVRDFMNGSIVRNLRLGWGGGGGGGGGGGRNIDP